jgi:hypothetical protein
MRISGLYQQEQPHFPELVSSCCFPSRGSSWAKWSITNGETHAAQRIESDLLAMPVRVPVDSVSTCVIWVIPPLVLPPGWSEDLPFRLERRVHDGAAQLAEPDGKLFGGTGLLLLQPPDRCANACIG